MGGLGFRGLGFRGLGFRFGGLGFRGCIRASRSIPIRMWYLKFSGIIATMVEERFKNSRQASPYKACSRVFSVRV